MTGGSVGKYLGVEARVPLGPEADVDVEAHGTLRHVTVGHAQIPQDLTSKKAPPDGKNKNRARDDGVVTVTCCLPKNPWLFATVH